MNIVTYFPRISINWFLLMVFLLLLSSCSQDAIVKDSQDDMVTESSETSINRPIPAQDQDSIIVAVAPLLDVFKNMNAEGDFYYTEEQWVIHDPSSIVKIDDYLMIAVTGKAQEDGYDCGLETWYVFPGDDTLKPGQCLLTEKPQWIKEEVPTNDGAYWAPGFFDNKTLYYSVPSGSAMEEAEGSTSCIGKLTAKGTPPNLVWEDHGTPITCTLEGENNIEEPEPESIDPEIFTDEDGSVYLVYGGGHIWITKIDAVSGEQKEGEWWSMDENKYFHVANGPNFHYDGSRVIDPEDGEWIEAPFMYKREHYYYLFANWYSCCMGSESTYQIIVGRSESPLGPFKDKKGINLLDGGGEVFLKTSRDLIGPGHAGIFRYTSLADGSLKEAFSFHYYPENEEPWATIKAFIIEWTDDGWPLLTDEDLDTMDVS